jgi:hypothetical protein
LKANLEQTLNTILNGDPRLPMLRKSITRNFLDEHGTYEKVSIYLKSLDLGFGTTKLKKLLKDLVRIRAGLTHSLYSNMYDKHPSKCSSKTR